MTDLTITADQITEVPQGAARRLATRGRTRKPSATSPPSPTASPVSRACPMSWRRSCSSSPAG